MDAGLVFWPLVSRLFALAVLSLVVALVYPTLLKANGLSGNAGYALSAVLAVAIAGGAWAMFQPHASVSPAGNGPGLTRVDPAKAQKDWAHYGNDEGGSRFAVLDQIGAETIRLTIGEKSPALGFTLTELPLPVGTILGIVEREQNVFIPTGDTRLRVGDKAVLFASIENMPRALEVIEGTEE